MTAYKRLIAQVHDIQADTPEQADQIARIRANAANDALKPLGKATAWAPIVTEADSADGQLLDILDGLCLADEIDDNPERNPRPGFVEIGHTTIPERLLAWRDAAIQQALAAIQQACNVCGDPGQPVDDGTGQPYALCDEDDQAHASVRESIAGTDLDLALVIHDLDGTGTGAHAADCTGCALLNSEPAVYGDSDGEQD